MKDAKGHGSNPRGGANAAKAMRAQLIASHQSATNRLARSMKDFVKNESGAGTEDHGLLGATALPDLYHIAHSAIHEYGHKYSDALHHMARHFFG